MCVCACVRVHRCVSLHMSLFVCACVRARACVCVCMGVYVCMCTCANNTNTLTSPLKQYRAIINREFQQKLCLLRKLMSLTFSRHIHLTFYKSYTKVQSQLVVLSGSIALVLCIAKLWREPP